MMRPASEPWSEWHPLALAGASPNPGVLAETLDGGQAFRWHPVAQPGPATPAFRGRWSDCLAEVRPTGGGLQWRAPVALEARVASAIGPYFAGDRDFGALADALPWRSDAHLSACLQAFPGLRLLRQPFGETLLGFLCSATKQIVQIKQMLALLAERHGERGALPTWPALARIPEHELRDCLLGFRARYIADTAAFLAGQPAWLAETERLPYAEARERLCTLPGVGEKIADCVLLFGAGRLEAFPVDVWILRTMTERYGLRGWKPAQVAHFGRIHFGPLAGLAQQYLFAYERRRG